MVIVDSSFGKDSTAMIHLMLEFGDPFDYVVFFETGWDFPQMEAHIAQVEKNTGIKTIRIRNYRYFDDLLKLYGWPHSSGGWCAASKRDNLKKIHRALKATTVCIGFSADEVNRSEKSAVNKVKHKIRYPLIEYGFTGSDALDYCKMLGYDWGGLYDVFSRVSCFCCPKAGQKRIDKLAEYFPELFIRYLEMCNIAESK